MKKIISVILSAALIIASVFCVNLAVVNAATSGTCGATGSSVNWEYDSSTKTLTLTGTGATKNYGATAANRPPWYSVKGEITTLVVGEGITTLGYLNFYGFSALTSVSLPQSLTTIGGNAAEYGAFRECTALQNITLPEGLTSIESMAFRGCTALKSITFPNSLTSLGTACFRDCTSLETVTFGTGLTSTGVETFYDSGVKKINFSSTITAVDGYSFFNTKLSTVEIPETVTSIGIRAFANCSFLLSATVYNANCDFGGIKLINSGEDPFNGSSQELTMYGHALSTTQTYAEEKGYNFVSIDDCNHENTHEVITLEPTCTEPGKTTQVCDDCGFVVSETELPAKGHTYELTETDDESETDGHIYTFYKCSVCGEEKTEIEHVSYIEGFYDVTVIVEGSCTKTGLERHSCTVEGCGKSETVTQKAGHTVESYTVITEPTCTEDGSEEGVCTVCGQTVTQSIPATGHTNELVSTEINEEDGHTYETYKCSVCAADTVNTIHNDWIDGNYTSTVITDPTCTVNGVQRDVCNICGESRLVSIPANGEHDWYETSRTEPTCTAVGKIYYACRNCDRTKSENIDSLGHDYVLDEANSVEATCTTAGYNRYKCSRCSSATTETIAAKGHTPVEDSMVIVKEASCEETGLVTAVCSVCGADYELVEAALGHDYQDVIVPIEDKPGHAMSTPTCTRCQSTTAAEMIHQEWIEGYYTNSVVTEGSCTVARITKDTCTICNTTRNNTVMATGHDYSFTEINESGSFVYTCSKCGGTVTRTPAEIRLLWNIRYVNKAPDDSTVLNGYYFDVNNDNIINAKDYAILNKAYRANTATAVSQ